MLKRARKHIENGDIAGARLFLERGLEQGNAEAAVLLGATYDPLWLLERRVHGVAADPGRARSYYTKAFELGVTDPAAILKSLGPSPP